MEIAVLASPVFVGLPKMESARCPVCGSSAETLQCARCGEPTSAGPMVRDIDLCIDCYEIS